MKTRWKVRLPARVCNLSRSLHYAYAAAEGTHPHTPLGIAANDPR